MKLVKQFFFFWSIIFIFSLFDFPFSFLVSCFQHFPKHRHTDTQTLTRILAHKLTSRNGMWNSTRLPCTLLYSSICQKTHIRAASSPPYPRHHLPGLSLFHRFYSFFHRYHSTRPYREDVSICVRVWLLFSPFLLFWHLFWTIEEITCILQKSTLQF